MELARAELIAAELLKRLEPVTARAQVAGSVRRQRPEVKDIEIVCQPYFEDRYDGQLGLFHDAPAAQVNLLDQLVDAWLESGRAGLRLDKNAHPAMGTRYKRLVYRGTWTVPLDLFIVQPPAQWGLILLIRTGSGVGPNGGVQDGFGPAMLARWKQISGGGRSEDGCLLWPDGSPCETPEEEDVFRVCRMGFVPPEERIDRLAVDRYAHQAAPA